MVTREIFLACFRVLVLGLYLGLFRVAPSDAYPTVRTCGALVRTGCAHGRPCIRVFMDFCSCHLMFGVFSTIYHLLLTFFRVLPTVHVGPCLSVLMFTALVIVLIIYVKFLIGFTTQLLL